MKGLAARWLRVATQGFSMKKVQKKTAKIVFLPFFQSS
uniref:Uncharacterized protein n=1 Tax=Candidatus Berkiella aquae TaxID=295108 RepID=A0A0Q9YYA9_9GAMM